MPSATTCLVAGKNSNVTMAQRQAYTPRRYGWKRQPSVLMQTRPIPNGLVASPCQSIDRRNPIRGCSQQGALGCRNLLFGMPDVRSQAP